MNGTHQPARTIYWMPGDIALCIKVGGWFTVHDGKPSDGPRCGQVLTVTALNADSEGIGLHLEGWPDWRSFRADRFVKVTPPKADKFDREIIKRLRRHERVGQ